MLIRIDTGSSNTWVGADKKYKKTKTSKDTGKTIQVSYGSGQFSGEEYTDTVDLGNGLVIEKQGLGVARRAEVNNFSHSTPSGDCYRKYLEANLYFTSLFSTGIQRR